MNQSSTRWVRDVPTDPVMQSQWQQEAIPWCITHDQPDELDEYGDHGGLCEVSTGGPDHKWWKDK